MYDLIVYSQSLSIIIALTHKKISLNSHFSLSVLILLSNLQKIDISKLMIDHRRSKVLEELNMRNSRSKKKP